MTDGDSDTPAPDGEDALPAPWAPEPGYLSRLAAEVAGVAAGAALGMIGDPVVGPALGPAITAGLRLAMDEIRANGVRQAGRVLGEAAVGADIDVEDLVSQLVSSPEHVQLLATALNAAATATDDDVLAALARGLANAATDDAKVSDETEMARALREIGPAHLRLMRQLFRTSPWVELDDTPGGIRDAGLHGGQTRDSILSHEPALTESWDSLIATVTRLGLVAEKQPTLQNTAINVGAIGPRNRQTLSPRTWQITDFGTRLYDRVRNHG